MNVVLFGVFTAKVLTALAAAAMALLLLVAWLARAARRPVAPSLRWLRPQPLGLPISGNFVAKASRAGDTGQSSRAPPTIPLDPQRIAAGLRRP
jgi:hypothetical protein